MRIQRILFMKQRQKAVMSSVFMYEFLSIIQKTDNSVHSILLKPLPRKRRKMACCCALAGTKLFIFDNMKKIMRQTVHSPRYFRKIVEIQRFALQVAILDKCQNYYWDRGGFGTKREKQETVQTLLRAQLACRGRYRNFTPFIIKVQEILLWILTNSAYD